MTFPIEILILMAISLAFSFFFSLSEVSLVAANTSHLKKLSASGDRRAMVAYKLITTRKIFFGTILVGNNIAIVAFSAMGESIYQSESTLALIRNILIFDGIILIMGEIIPKSLALEAPERFSLITAPSISLFSRILRPFVEISYLIPGLLIRRMGDGDSVSENLVTDQQIRLAFIQGSKAGTVEEEERELGLKVIDFAETTVERVMTLRGDIFALPSHLSVKEATERIREIGFSRIPIYDDDNEDDIEGFINVKDLIRAFVSDQSDQSLSDLKREIAFIPEKKKVLDLMIDFQRERSHISMVVDETGSITGLVTLEDLLEEVVGEIYDEHDEAEDMIHKLGSDTYLLDGRLEIDTVNETLPLMLEEGVYETLGGYVVGLFGKVPLEGASIQHTNATFTVMKMDERRIDKVKVKISRSVPPAETNP